MTGPGINGTPQPKRHQQLGGREIPPRHQRPHMQGGGGGSSKSGGCLLVLLGLVSAPWAADLVLAAS